MPKTCVAGYCSKTNADKVSLHFFPKEQHYRRLWTKFVKKNRANFTIPGPESSAVLCSDHFKEKDFEHFIKKGDLSNPLRKNLRADAVPTINKSVPSASNKRSADDSDSDEDVPSTKRSYIHKLEVARIIEEYSNSSSATGTDFETAMPPPSDAVIPPPLEAAVLPTPEAAVTKKKFRTCGTQLSGLKKPYRSKGVGYGIITRDMWTTQYYASDASTQCEPPVQAPTIPTAPEQAPPIPAAPEQAPPIPAAPEQAPPIPAAPEQAPPIPAAPEQAPPIPAAPEQAQPIPAAPEPALPVQLPQELPFLDTVDAQDVEFSTPTELCASTPKKTVQAPNNSILESPIKPETPIKELADKLYTPSNESMQDASICSEVGLQDITLETRPDDPQTERKFLVFEKQLLELFTVCPFCSGSATGNVKNISGTCVTIQRTCKDNNCKASKWRSQPFVNKMPAGNLITSAAILVSGCLPSQALRLFSYINMACVSRSTFHKHQKFYVIPTVVCAWRDQQEQLIQQLKSMDGGLELAGDGRSDSPGHCAKYGGYNLIEQRLNKVIDIQLVQSNEVKNSNACELEGLKRSMLFLTETSGLKLSILVTDRHKQINAHIRDELIGKNPAAKDMQHFYDIWHISKGLGKKISALAKKKDCEDAGLWRKSVINHVYYVASEATGDEKEDTAEAIWTSITNHIQDIHEHENKLYPMCAHKHLRDEERDKQWLKPGTQACELLCDMITSPYLIKDIRRMSPTHQTSTLEAFHSLMIKFAPKSSSFMWLGQLARYYLAGLHFNANSDRMQAVTRDGRPKFSVRFPKYKKPGEYSVRAVKSEPSYEYAHLLIQTVLVKYKEDRNKLKHSIDDLLARTPAPLAASFQHPNKAEAVRDLMTRYSGDQSGGS